VYAYQEDDVRLVLENNRFGHTLECLRAPSGFLKKGGPELELHAFTHPLRAAQEDQRLVAVTQKRSVDPETDYLANKGRTRVLAYELPAQAAVIADVCAAILSSAYAISSADELVIESQN
jgi:hypothetical protein